jgi:hypothetical protein
MQEFSPASFCRLSLVLPLDLWKVNKISNYV